MMISKFFRATTLLLVLLVALNGFSANDKIMNYIKGSDIGSTTSLGIMDQKFAGFFVSPVTNEIKTSYITAKLRYEESFLPLFSSSAGITDNFSLTVNYTIELTDENYNTVTYTNQSLQIDYDINSAGYKDVDILRYEGFLQGDITITSIDYWVDGVATFVYTTVPEDVYLELSCEVERYYDLVIPSPWNVYPDGSAATLNNKNELELSWDYVLGAESFDVEWVFVDITGNAATIQSANMPFNWKNATRINTTNNFYNISMAYPSGMLIYRVRPVGVDLNNGDYDITIFGDWSDPGTTTNTNYAYGTQKNGYVHIDLANDKNWTYNVAYAEEGKRKEGISYFDGSARSRQEVTILNTDQNAIIGETKYDFEGRPAVSMLPTPISSEGIKFYEYTGGGPVNDFDKNRFDYDSHFSTGPLTVSGNSIADDYYSSSSNSNSLFKNYIPDAESYPYSRTTYMRDGTDRIKEQTGVGSNLMHVVGNTTKYYYGSPADMELERLFGNETGPTAFYQKNMVVDPNGQVSIQYLDKEGRTVATSLAGEVGENSPLLDLDYKPAPVDITADLLSNNNYTANESKSIHVLTMSQSGNVDFTYTLDSTSFQWCDTTYYCTFTLDIKVLDEYDVDQLPSPGISYTGYYDSQNPSTLPTVPFTTTASLPIGTYTVIKTLKIDEIDRKFYEKRFEERIRENLETQECLPYDPPEDLDCPTCEEKCAIAYKEFLYYDAEEEEDIYAYYDENGDEFAWSPLAEADLDAAQQQELDDLVDACEEQCTTAVGFNLCEQKLQAMILQMSPGGQYFDNLKEKYQDVDPDDGLLDLDANGEPMINDGVSPSTFVYDIDDWLETWFGTSNPSSASFTANISSLVSSYSTWEDLRNAWNTIPHIGDSLVKDHPEYCAYKFNCLDNYTYAPGGITPCVIDRQHVLDYDYYMFAGTKMSESEKEEVITSNDDYIDFLNPLALTNNASAGTYINEYIASSSQDDDPTYNTDFLKDPLFACDFAFDYYSLDDQITVSISSAENWITLRLYNFLGIDGDASANPAVAPTTYHSIWYVMDDPLNIHTYSSYAACSTATGISQEAFDFYNNMHGNSALSSPVIGFFDNNTTSPDPNKVNKYQFFRGVYKFYRDFILYQLFKNKVDPCSGVAGYYSYWDNDVVNGSNAYDLDLTSYNSVRDQPYGAEDLFELVWPRNLTFDIFDTSYTNMNNTVVTNTPSMVKDACEDDCDNNANAWMSSLSGCTTSLTQQELDDMEADLKAICKIGCSASPIPSTGLIGSSDGDGGTTSILASDDGTTALYDFDDVIAHYTSGCTETVVYPVTVPTSTLPAAIAECNCGNFEEYITTTLSKSWPLIDNSAGDKTSILSSVNGLTSPTGTYVWTDLLRWEDYCNDSVGDLIDFPATLECIDCKCENLAFFITERLGVDPYTLAGQDLTDAKDLINNEFGSSYTTGDITNMMGECEDVLIDGDPNLVVNSYFTDLPDIFRCNANLETTDPDDDCATEINNDQLIAYNNLWEQQLKDAKDEFYNEYTARCMLNIQSRETFIAEYELNEFMYTLYYYDQAGNLIKTVPPEGVVPKETDLTNPTFKAFYDDVEDHRVDPYDATSNPGGTVHQNVEHTMVTQYKYDSYNNLIWQSTPDGGETNFWYDKLGRLVLSQNAKQAVAANYVYSYTLYDELGRIYEVGEVESTTQIDDEFDDYNGEFIPWVTHVTNATRTQVTSTYYDEALNSTVEGFFTGQSQNELRTRVSSITREENFDGDDDTYDYGTHFSYDIHGNVKEIIQENNGLLVTHKPERIKKITYEYDLISGNVNRVNYQPGKSDQFYHRYCYDADNRITKVETSRDNYLWDTDAKYFYYEHGPLARVEIGEKQVAGSDYAYTLQGWIKGINSNTLTASLDIGRDADLTATELNSHFATDAYSYSLGYFEGDYSSADDNFLSTVTGNFNTNGPSLYNGNIRHMVTGLLNTSEVPQTVQGTVYRYDQANRIRKSNVYSGVINNSFSAATDNDYYRTEHHYDLNGNITQLNRYNDSGTLMDELEYKYLNDGNGRYEHDGHTSSYDYRDGSSPTTNKNQLTQVIDIGVISSSDFRGTSANNYEYDEIGQLIRDDSDSIVDIIWDVYNKISEIQYDGTAEPTRADIMFKYDASGNRIAKILKTKSGGSVETADNWTYYFYERDASGNIMAVYKQEIDELSTNYYESTVTQIQKDIYGSSRLGTESTEIEKITRFCASFTTSGATALTCGTNPNYSTNKLAEVNSNEVITIEDETTTDLNVTLKANEADVVLGGLSSYTVVSGSLLVDGIGQLYLPANQTVTLEVDGYSFTTNTIGNGLYVYPNNSNTLKYSAAGPISISLPASITTINNYAREIGNKVYEKTNHLGNVLVTLNDRKFPVRSSQLGYHYNFESSSDNEVNGSGLNPTTNTATYVSSAGYDGTDVIETNTGDYLDFSDDARLDFGSNDFTIAVWVKKVSQLNYGNSVVNKWNTGASPGTNEWSLSLNSGQTGTSGGPGFSIEIGSTIYTAKKATAVSPNTGQWYFLVGKREKDTVSIYIDGVLEDTTILSSSHSGAAINNITGREMHIGRLDNGTNYSNMQVDNLMIFDEALSDEQIESMYSGNSYAYYEPDVLSYSDYYPFGALMPGRWSGTDYRYGMNGMEKDDEVSGTGNTYTTEFRSYDPRIARWKSLDPLMDKYPWQSPYVAFNNNPIYFADPTGLEGEPKGKIKRKGFSLFNKIRYSIFKPKWLKRAVNKAKYESRKGYDATITFARGGINKRKRAFVNSTRPDNIEADFTYAHGENVDVKNSWGYLGRRRGGWGSGWGYRFDINIIPFINGNKSSEEPQYRTIGWAIGDFESYNVFGFPRAESVTHPPSNDQKQRYKNRRNEYNKKHGLLKGSEKYKDPVKRSWFNIFFYR